MFNNIKPGFRISSRKGAAEYTPLQLKALPTSADSINVQTNLFQSCKKSKHC